MHSGLIDVQSHTYDMHQSAQFEQQRPVRESILPLKTESNLQYRQDLYADSQVYQKEYRKHTGKTLYVLAYPKGAYTPYTEQIVHKLGYAITFTTNSKKVNRVVQKDPTSLYALGRLSVSEAVTKAELLQYLEQKKALISIVSERLGLFYVFFNYSACASAGISPTPLSTRRGLYG